MSDLDIAHHYHNYKHVALENSVPPCRSSYVLYLNISNSLFCGCSIPVREDVGHVNDVSNMAYITFKHIETTTMYFRCECSLLCILDSKCLHAWCKSNRMAHFTMKMTWWCREKPRLESIASIQVSRPHLTH